MRLETLESRAFLELMYKTLLHHPAAINKSLQITDNDSRLFSTDPRLLRRIVSNMLINALEATPTGGTVTLGCAADDENLCFHVHNEQVIPRLLQYQIFKQAASTKGHGRGNGTYSIKLLSELLDGAVSFTSREKDGTTFSLQLGHLGESN